MRFIQRLPVEPPQLWIWIIQCSADQSILYALRAQLEHQLHQKIAQTHLQLSDRRVSLRTKFLRCHPTLYKSFHHLQKTPTKRNVFIRLYLFMCNWRSLQLVWLCNRRANHAFELSLEHLSIKMFEPRLKPRRRQLENLRRMLDTPAQMEKK